ncbi:hypothetical protein POL68_20090 [Stigmatella sp. ncwal1]|uniref:Uncharacterized protein n=1 Tax=Stigmatella ashevillensis TaxID=2995309 RepID=A0ABT5DCG1_9BACT|nr:hypothetical protein [Stigmatella ashevillena]MDC0710788.1 hypothetical protein [Stigmatella ashevillena]
MHSPITLTQQGDFTEFLGDLRIIASSIGPDRSACVLAVDAADAEGVFAREELPGGASSARSRTRRPYKAVAFQYDGLSFHRTELPELPYAFPFIQILGTGHVLVAGGRCGYSKGRAELNASLYTPEGQLTHQLTLGDGIQDIQVARNGEIWVSYFDEGVFGNHGWTQPIGAPGLVCFGLEGQVLWNFTEPGGMEGMADCYALNVADDATWACYYTGFPVVRIAPDRTTRAWKNPITGAYALTVSRSHVLHFGGYQEKQSRCTVQRFGTGSLTAPRDLTLLLPTGEPLTTGTVVGRDSILHAFVGTGWYQFDLNEWPEW